MVTDNQVRRYSRLMQTKKTKAIAASKAGMDEKTARKYERLGKLPSEVKREHTWRTRRDPFSAVWKEVEPLLETNPGLEAKTIFDYLQRRHPGAFSDGQLRTLQRHLKTWRALEGIAKEVFFEQVHHPGIVCQSDFTHMNDLGITINHQRFNHLLYHFVLPYSNWETGTICFSESFESLSTGFQNALWELGGVVEVHQTDRLSAAVCNTSNPKEFTQRYQSLLSHYRMKGRKIQAGKAHENGDIEQRHHRFKRALDQALMLRGSREFDCRESYERFLKQLFNQLNANRNNRFQEEIRRLKCLPSHRLDTCKRLCVKVGRGSTIRVNHNVYSVHSRLIGEWVHVRLHAEYLEIWYAQRCIETIPRLRGEGNHKIQYHHIIDWLVRKPGAFKNYRYRRDLFPTHRFRVVYDQLSKRVPASADKEYLKILHLAAKENEQAVDQALAYLIEHQKEIRFEQVQSIVTCNLKLSIKDTVIIDTVDVEIYDQLFNDRSFVHGTERQVL